MADVTINALPAMPANTSSREIHVSAIDGADSIRKDYRVGNLPVPVLASISDRLTNSNYAAGSMLIAPQDGVNQLYTFDGSDWINQSARPRSLGTLGVTQIIDDADLKYSANSAAYSTSLSGVFVGSVSGTPHRSFTWINFGTLEGTLPANGFKLRFYSNFASNPGYEICFGVNQSATEPAVADAWAGTNYIECAQKIATNASTGWHEINLTDGLQALIARDGRIDHPVHVRIYPSTAAASGNYFRIMDGSNISFEPTWQVVGSSAETAVTYNGLPFILVSDDTGSSKGRVLRRDSYRRPCDLWDSSTVYRQHRGYVHTYDLSRSFDHVSNLNGNTTMTFSNFALNDRGLIDIYNQSGATRTIDIQAATGYTLEGTRPTSLTDASYTQVSYRVRQKPGGGSNLIIETATTIAAKAIV